MFGAKCGPQPVAAHSEPDRLYGEIGRLKMGLDWPYLLRGMAIVRPNQVWSTDIAYIRLARGFV